MAKTCRGAGTGGPRWADAARGEVVELAAAGHPGHGVGEGIVPGQTTEVVVAPLELEGGSPCDVDQSEHVALRSFVII